MALRALEQASVTRRGLAIALSGSLTRCADHGANRCPGVPFGSGHRDSIGQSGLGLDALGEGRPYRSQGGGVDQVGRIGVVALEPSSQLVGVIDDFVEASGHGRHLRYLDRAGMAWTTTGPSLEETTPIS